MTRFILIGTQRSGTTLLRSSLDSHPEICCLGEVFYVNKALKDASRNRQAVTRGKNLSTGFSSWREHSYQCYLEKSPVRKIAHLLARGSVTRAYLDELYAMPGYKAVGFKVMTSQLERFPAVLPYVNRHRVSVIHMVRENPFDILLSRLSMGLRGYAHSGGGAGESLSLQIPTVGLVERLRSIHGEAHRWRKELSGDVPYMLMTYERFVTDRRAASEDLLSFLGVDTSVELKSELIKLNAAPLIEVVTNLSEVRACLKGTDFEWCLPA